MNIPKILERIRPGALWVLRGDDYDGLEWNDDSQSKPTIEEIEAGSVILAAETESIKYKINRATEMPPVGDVLDAICKFIDSGDKTEFDEMQINRNAVKAKYPK